MTEQKDPKRQLLGKIAKARGKQFEERLDQSFAYYAQKGFAVIEKTPEPMRPTKSLSNATCKKHLTEIAAYAARVMWEISRMAYSSFKVDTELLGSCLDVKIPKETLRDGSVSLAEIAGIESVSESMPEKLMFCLAYSAADGAENGYYRSVWEAGQWAFKHMNNVMLNGLYELLKTLGYEMSDEEKAFQNGTHEMFEEVAS